MNEGSIQSNKGIGIVDVDGQFMRLSNLGSYDLYNRLQISAQYWFVSMISLVANSMG